MEDLIAELRTLLNGGGAHVSFKEATSGIPFKMLGEAPHGLPYSIWQLVEHIRIAQWDMLEFSRDAGHTSPEWPKGYWPSESAPSDEPAWLRTLEKIGDDLEAFMTLLETEDLYKPFPYGNGQNILREALQIADHNAYHIAEIVMIRRLLGIWK
ncbi:DinB family protein [Arcticibacter sp.]|uniref:DinB family protein n=1 Tax=Arcticibacter sp. TaxID=1872630 RepID=UPI00388EBB8E